MNHLSLAGQWQVTWTDGQHGRPEHFQEPLCDPRRYLVMSFPGSIQNGLIQAGILDDPREGMNTLKARWVEEQYWILRREFDASDEMLLHPITLHIGVLDGVAQVALNGKLVGAHCNANRPADFDLSGRLVPGRNDISILLESGLFRVSDLPGSDYSQAPETRLNKRQHLRQAQYQFGWDWNPRLVYLGINGSIELSWGEEPRLVQVGVISHVSEDLGWGRIRVCPVFQVQGEKPQEVTLRLFSLGGLCAETDVVLQAGVCATEVALDIPQPQLWWPRGYGDAFLYPLYLQVLAKGQCIAHWEGRTGLRRVEIDQPAHPEAGRYFHLKINNRPIFCKGANWVPPELNAHEVPPGKIARMVALAEAENMNMLRIWGGGVWAGHTLLSLCDERGILVWHDLLFACSKYPADRPEFLAEVEQEVSWGIREFSSHPSLVVWCGNNELEVGYWEWGYRKFGNAMPDHALFHQVIPSLMQQLDPARPYWPSSPYSSPTISPSDPTCGDQHPWGVSLGRDDIDFWAYRKYVDRFPNEGGVLGCATVSSLRRFLHEKELKFRSPAWEHHDNAVEFWHNDPGTSYRMVEFWLGLKAEQLDIETYTLASGLLQAEALKEYILNYRHRWPSTGSAIYWMFNDSWPTVHGWGTFDYYLNRKLSFHPVRRAFSDITVALADEGNTVGIFVVNDTDCPVVLNIECGTFTPRSAVKIDADMSITVPAFSSERVYHLPRDSRRIYYAVLRDVDNRVLAQDRMMFRPFFYWKPGKPVITIDVVKRGAQYFVHYLSPTWVWGVVLDPGGEANIPDDVFDLLPGIPYEIPLAQNVTPWPVAFTGNALLA